MFFLHVIEDNEISQQYASEGLKHFKDVFDVELTLFPAYTPDALSPELRFAEFKVATNKRKLKHQLARKTRHFQWNAKNVRNVPFVYTYFPKYRNYTL